jgi:predicted secreted Zn-dependent protease
LWYADLSLQIALIVLSSLWAASARCEVHEKLSESLYDVYGDDHSSLLSLLNAATPIHFEGKKYHAFTTWNVHWNFRWFREPDGSCRITSATIALTSRMQLPRLIGGSPEQRQQFYPYLSALRTHESGHYQVGKDAAEAINRRIEHLPTASTCHSLEEDADRLGYAVLAEYQAHERQYDQSTGYGKTQGASLNP